jgi:hypothetical protein
VAHSRRLLAIRGTGPGGLVEFQKTESGSGFLRPRSRPQPAHQVIQQLAIQAKLAGDLIGLHENRLGLLCDFVGQVLEILGNRAVVQVELFQPIGDLHRDG